MYSFNTCLLHLFSACVCFTLGNVVPEPFFEDFHDQAFEESQLFFVDQQGKLHIAAIVIFSIYSIELELHYRKVYLCIYDRI
jgi:hypothetical protein